MYLVIYGADYCSHTQNLWNKLGSFPFMYMPYLNTMDKQLYWKQLKLLSNEEHLTFPTCVLFDEKNEMIFVKLETPEILVSSDGKIFQTSDLKLPTQKITLVKGKKNLQEVLHLNKHTIFTYQP